MSKKPDNPNDPDQANLANEAKGARPVVEYTAGETEDAKYKTMAWKGFEEEEEEDDDDGDVSFGNKEPIPEDELDMTPMVDVTFLLLIFFMVTASFTLQKSIQQPPASTDEPSLNNPVEEDLEKDYVEVLIDQNNTYYVTSRDEEEVEAPSERDMRSRVKDAREIAGATRLIIRAHLESKHSKVVTAYDAGVSAGLEQIEIKTTDEDY
jgi:biopolymer transport protein ExbD